MGRASIRSIADEIITMYRSLAGERGFADTLAEQNVIGGRLRLLSAIGDGALNPDTFSFDEARGFHEALLDAIALQYATGGERSVFAPLKTGDPSRLGRSRNRLSKLLGDIDSQLDWHFQLLIQGWGTSQGLS